MKALVDSSLLGMVEAHQGKPMPRRSRSLYVETRDCHFCHKPGHLRSNCKALRDQTMTKELNAQTTSRAMDRLMWQTADPVPVRHQDGSVRWQIDGPVVSPRPSKTPDLKAQEELHHAAMDHPAMVPQGVSQALDRETRIRIFFSDGATGLVAGTRSGDPGGGQGAQCTASAQHSTV